MSIVRISTRDMSREDWLDLRRRGLGGSDASAVVGLNPFSSRLYLFADKTGMIPEREDNEAMRQGRDLEDYVAKRWEEATGKKVRRENHMLYNDQYPWAFANLDRVVIGEKALLECKTTSVYNKNDFEGGQIPDYYYVQCQHYLAVTGFDRAYLAVLVLNSGFYHFVIERNQEDIDALMKAEQDFWEKHVLAGVSPDADGSESAQFVLDRQERKDDTALLMDMEQAFIDLEYVNAQLKTLGDQKDMLRQQILQRMGEKNRGMAVTWKCSYLSSQRTSIDSTKLKQVFPAVYQECARITESQTFRVTKIKEEK